MKRAKVGDTVKVHYTGKLQNGNVFETSEDRKPKEFTIGQNEIIPGFEKAVVGMEVGESKTIEVPAEEAFGPYRKELVQVIERNLVPADMEPKEGDRLQAVQQNGQQLEMTVKAVSTSTLTLDANHVLAGQDLTFDIKLIEVA